jgi:hypothetical protein
MLGIQPRLLHSTEVFLDFLLGGLALFDIPPLPLTFLLQEEI